MTAHWNQAVDLEWQYLPESTLFDTGGSIIGLAPLRASDDDLTSELTIIFETLEGNCGGDEGYVSNETEAITGMVLVLSEENGFDLKGRTFSVFYSSEDELFVEKDSIDVDEDGILVLPDIGRDEIYTITTKTNLRKGAAEGDVPANAPFPIPYKEHFEDWGVEGNHARFFSDHGGSFALTDRGTM